MFNKKDKINETYECRKKQWNYWKNDFFGGLPLVDVILSHPPILALTNEYPPPLDTYKPKYFDFNSEIEEGNILFAHVDYVPKSVYGGYDTKLYLDGRLQKGQTLYCWSAIIDFNDITPRYSITEENVANYLESLPIKEELMNMYIFRDLVSLICNYLNRDHTRMAEAQEHIHKGVISSSEKVDSIFQEFFEDRNSTMAQIKALYTKCIIPPNDEKNPIAGQESTLEKKIENQAIIIPERIRKKFEFFIKNNTLRETEEGFLVINKGYAELASFYTDTREESKRREVPTAKEIIEYVRKPNGDKYSLYSLKREKKQEI